LGQAIDLALNSPMRIVLDFPQPIADALRASVRGSGDTVDDLIAEAVRSSPLVQRALSDAYPKELTTFLQSEIDR
jgi:hypothetical protein